MGTLEARVANLEGKVEEHGHAIPGLRDALTQFGQRVDRRFDAIDRRFDAIDRRFEAMDRRFEAIDRRFEVIDHRFDGLDSRFGVLDRDLTSKLSKHFMWLVGMQITTLVAIVSALLARG